MGELLKSRGPVVSVESSVPVLDAVRLMDAREIGAVVVKERGTMVGIFSERDLLRRVVAAGKDPASTRVGEVMTSPVVAMSSGAEAREAVDAMILRHFRHVPVVDRGGRPVAMLSFRGAMAERIGELEHELDVLEAYLGYDGAAG